MVLKGDTDPYEDGNCVGYIDTSGELVIPFEYDMPRLFPYDSMENGIVRLFEARTDSDHNYTPQYYIRSDGVVLGKVEMIE